jgi:hypothetical protein
MTSGRLCPRRQGPIVSAGDAVTCGTKTDPRACLGRQNARKGVKAQDGIDPAIPKTGYKMKGQLSEHRLRHEIRDLTSKLKQIREEIREEIRDSTHPRVVHHVDDRPVRRARKR